MSRRFRLRPMVHEVEDGEVWAGILPDGPILRLGGAAAPLLAVLAERGDALDAAGVADRMRAEIDGMPQDAENVIASFLDELVGLGLVETAGNAPSDQENP